MKRLGLHVRLDGSLLNIAYRMAQLNVPFFQCFFILLANDKIIKPSTQEIEQFVSFRQQYFDQLYVHGSYWINLSGLFNTGMNAFKRELALAKKLQFTHMVLHPGSATGGKSKKDGIDALAKSLNLIFKTEHDIKIMLENTAHGNLAIGSDLQDFALLLEKLDQPDKLTFCIDTSHAYAYGYDVDNVEEFVAIIDQKIGTDRISLIHLNDTKEKKGSRIDRHCMIGTGKLGKNNLQQFVLHEKLASVPIIMELPVLHEKEEERVFHEVVTWL